ncbi:MAG: ABC transporter ATP-binding protein [Desulfurococcales archaeon]|nr:ABC transporter ATP-binding protein [Desulfurococcales archaeon]
MRAPIILDNVTKTYGDKKALSNVSVTVKENKITGLLGPNGSGKTTMIKIILGIIRKDAGKVLLRGRDPFKDPRAREHVGYIPERPELPSSMPVREVLITAAKIYGSTNPKDTVDEAISLAGLSGNEWKRFKELSAGLKQRAAIAHALISDPDILIADEPTSNLDPIERVRILDLLVDLNRKEDLTLLFTGHVLAEVSRVAEDIIVLRNGKLLFQGSPRNLMDIASIVAIRASDPVKLSMLLEERGFKTRHTPFSLTVYLSGREEIPRLMEALAVLASKHGIDIFSIDTVEASLEEMLRRE